MQPGGSPAPAAGLGLKPDHFRDVLEAKPALGFFEIHAENYMVPGGPFHHYLGRIRADYALSIHGVGLSIGGEAPLETHLDRLAALIDRYQPGRFPNIWPGPRGGNFTTTCCRHRSTRRHCSVSAEHIDRVQSRLGCRMLLENPSTYVEFAASDRDKQASSVKSWRVLVAACCST